MTKTHTIVDQTVLEAGSSPPLTSSLHSRNSASSAQESAYLRRAAVLRWTRLGLSVLAVGIAIAVVGCTGHVLHSYNHTHLASEWYLPLWPVDVDLKPTLGTMVPAVIVTITSLAYIIFALLPSPRSRTLHQVLLFLLTSIVGFVTTLFAVFFNQLLLYRYDVNTRDSLQTWTCKFYYGAQNFERDASTLNISVSGDQLIPAGFKRLCMESMSGQWLTVGLLVMEAICCGVAVWGLLAEKKIEKSRERRYCAGKCESEFA